MTNILLFLGSNDIVHIYVLSRDSNKFLVNYESEVYHQLAVSCRFASSGCSLKDAISPEARTLWLRGVETWKEFVRRWTVLEGNWSGRGDALEGGFDISDQYDDNIRDFAMDEDDRTIIATPRFSILTVRGMKDNRLLWNISGVVSFRWSEGFLAFINKEGNIEIWRRTTDVDYHQGKPVSTPLLPPSRIATVPSQYKRADSIFGRPDIEYLTVPTYGNLRGKYTPHAFIRTPSFALPQAFASKYPVVSFTSKRRPYYIHLYDIAEGIHIRSIDVEKMLESRVQSPSAMEVFFSKPPTDFCLSDNYVAISFESFVLLMPIHEGGEQHFHSVIIYETENPSLVKKSAYQLSKIILPGTNRHQKKLSFGIKRDENWSHLDHIYTTGTLAMDQFELIPPPEDETSANTGASILLSTLSQASATFTSLQISQDERHLVIVAKSGLLYLLPNFKEVARGSEPVEKSIQRIEIGKPLIRVIYSRFSRHFAVKTDEGDTYIIDIDPTFSSPLSPLQITPNLRTTVLHRLADFRIPKFNSQSTRMEFTRSRLWLLWDRRRLFEVAQKRYAAIREVGTEDSDVFSLLPEFDLGSFRQTICFVDFMSGV